MVHIIQSDQILALACGERSSIVFELFALRPVADVIRVRQACEGNSDTVQTQNVTLKPSTTNRVLGFEKEGPSLLGKLRANANKLVAGQPLTLRSQPQTLPNSELSTPRQTP